MTIDLKPRRRRISWLWMALVCSLAINAFVLGAFVTERLGFRHTDSGPRAVKMELRWLKDRLSPDSVTAIESSLDTLKPDVVARLQRLKTLRTELAVLAAAPEPDRAAIDEHLREIRIEVGAMQEQIQSRTFDAVLALPPDQRAALGKQPAD
ncbi:Heavy-metal resistance [Kaistia soli DSM 19436]|uniref:Heavy-metal resistance n=1 Tax=Kaistia soli DSM 19436 TaxID=1122133 RepID=A0A1M4V819_9HYPH|nr:periplasmic heavy metal sensor [Kaistia soli]SHE65037.1 Heavy-metal resistance [Kaistia soli DSM 19436]